MGLVCIQMEAEMSRRVHFRTLGVSIDLNCENISVRTVSIHSWTRFEQPFICKSTNEQKRVNGTINSYVIGWLQIEVHKL